MAHHDEEIREIWQRLGQLGSEMGDFSIKQARQEKELEKATKKMNLQD